MNLPKKLTSTRLIAIVSCLLAVGAYSAFLPPPASADDEIGLEGGYCYYAGLQYSLGSELNGKVCKQDSAGEYYWANITQFQQ
jgi:hypothetical protein